MSPTRQVTTWVAVADGAKALLLVNEGTDEEPLLYVLAKREFENPPTHVQGTDRPGRKPDHGPGQRSAMETTDWHEIGEERFVAEFAGRLNRAAVEGRFRRLVLIAPPKVIGLLRGALSAEASAAIVAEIGSDLTKHPVDAIEQHLAKAMAG
jgi:protein required for attachment to host cells